MQKSAGVALNDFNPGRKCFPGQLFARRQLVSNDYAAKGRQLL